MDYASQLEAKNGELEAAIKSSKKQLKKQSDTIKSSKKKFEKLEEAYKLECKKLADLRESYSARYDINYENLEMF